MTISDVNRDRHEDIVVDRPYGASGSQLVGLLAIEGARPGYKPSAGDVQAFQQELRRLLERQGY